MPDTLVSRFEANAARDPEHLALSANGRTLTFAQLNAAANRVAHRLIDEFGSQPEPVALHFDDALDWLVALVGVAKAGKFFAAMPAAWTDAQLVETMDNLRARVMLSHSRVGARANALCRLGEIVIHTDALDQSLPTHNPGLDIAPDALFNLIYTSGSTGAPKGVMQTHASYLTVADGTYGKGLMTTDTRLGRAGSFAYAGTYYSLAATLALGASFHVFEIGAGDPRAFARFIESERITVWHGVVSQVNNVVRELDSKARLASLKLVLLIGEPVKPTDVRRIFEALPGDCRLRHSLGSAECGCVAGWVFGRSAPIDFDPVPSGQLMSFVDVSVVGADGEPVADGEIGEMILRSRIITPGYWHQPELTAAAVGPIEPDGTRTFRSGDLGRFLPNGMLQHVGRVDSLVKINGQRALLSDIEGALSRLPNVRQSAVGMLKATDGEDRLVAWVVPSAQPFDGIAARRTLSEQLQPHMVPTHIVEVERFPMTPNGKLDRRMLPAPDWGARVIHDDALPPRDDVERKLAEIWRETLGVATIGIHDDFFDLGGDSLRAARITARTEEAFGVRVQPNALASATTVAKLAALVREPNLTRAGIVTQLSGDGAGASLFLVHMHAGGVLNYMKMARAMGDGYRVFAFKPIGFDGEAVPQDDIERMAALYVAAMREAQPSGPYFLGGHCFGGVVAYEMARQLEAMREPVAFLALIDSWTPNTGDALRPMRDPLNIARYASLYLRTHGAVYALRRAGHATRRTLRRASGDVELPLEDVVANLETVPESAHDLLRAHIAAFRAYRAGAYGGAVDLFRVALPPWRYSDQPLLGWDKVVHGGVRVHALKGTHRSIILDDGDARSLAQSLRSALDAQVGAR